MAPSDYFYLSQKTLQTHKERQRKRGRSGQKLLIQNNSAAHRITQHQATHHTNTLIIQQTKRQKRRKPDK